MGWFLFSKNDELVLGPFQGPVACTRIKKEKVFVVQAGPRRKL
jgi:putative methionine-R-sulfoxide reductase with GAF domain